MKRKWKILAIVITLVLLFAHYMIVDDELSKQTKLYLDLATPTSNLENNAFIHMMALGDKSDFAYESRKNAYLKVTNDSNSRTVAGNEILNYPTRLLNDDSITESISCNMKELSCLNLLKEQKDFLTKTYKSQFDAASEFVLKQNDYHFEPLSSLSTKASFDGFNTLNSLVGVSAYFYLLDGNYVKAEALLFNQYAFMRKAASTSLDIMPSVMLVAVFDRTIFPLVERLVAAKYQFKFSVEEYFYELAMNEISMQKLIAAEVKFLHNSLLVSNILNFKYCDSCNFNLGVMPHMTLNLYTENLLQKKLPDSVTKQEFLSAIKKDVEDLRLKSGNMYWLIATNPRNFIGELIGQALMPRYIDLRIDFAEHDLYLLLFKLAIKSQTTPIEELIKDDRYLDPYTGNRPYLIDSKVCYPPWPELDDEDGKHEPACIAIAEGR